ncbi:MAG: hypothetical protein WBD99_14600 [Thermodesulfobacteriota bacterium]
MINKYIKNVLLFIMLVATMVLLTLPATSFATEESGCDELSGRPQRLCKLYCEEINCVSEIPNVGFIFCDSILTQFEYLTDGNKPPCTASVQNISGPYIFESGNYARQL